LNLRIFRNRPNEHAVESHELGGACPRNIQRRLVAILLSKELLELANLFTGET